MGQIKIPFFFVIWLIEPVIYKSSFLRLRGLHGHRALDRGCGQEPGGPQPGALGMRELLNFFHFFREKWEEKKM